ncbi:hypothetical protein PRVXT_001200 [Proteinivorax tanatarense]|uniref:Chemotaxis methyl-accepting receptor HlyB-like 4HB MCP domain-containing protein n=1 Tax=Proteinivorax tanatarense TaxID=1260629 RepID=A0AAU7VQ11_9FIRM
MLKQKKKKLSLLPILGFFMMVIVGFLLILTYNDLIGYREELSEYANEHHQIVIRRHELYVDLLNDVTPGIDHSANRSIKNMINAIGEHDKYDATYFNMLQQLEDTMDEFREENFSKLNNQNLLDEFKENDEEYKQFIDGYNSMVKEYNRSLEGVLPGFISKMAGYNKMPQIN